MVWMTVTDISLADFMENSPFWSKFQARSTIRPGRHHDDTGREQQ